jgi:hypothetical protein
VKNIRITEQTLPEITMAIQVALDAKKEYQIGITVFDNSLHARQRALANIWYSQIAKEIGESLGYAEAYCKYNFGLRLRTKDDEEKEAIFRLILSGLSYEEKIAIIERQSDVFPILRRNGGLCVEGQAEYLGCIQRHFAEQGVILTSPREDELLHCKAASI